MARRHLTAALSVVEESGHGHGAAPVRGAIVIANLRAAPSMSGAWREQDSPQWWGRRGR